MKTRIPYSLAFKILFFSCPAQTFCWHWGWDASLTKPRIYKITNFGATLLNQRCFSRKSVSNLMKQYRLFKGFRLTLIWNINTWFRFVSFTPVDSGVRGKRDTTPELSFIFSFAISITYLKINYFFISTISSTHNILFPNNNVVLFHHEWNINSKFLRDHCHLWKNMYIKNSLCV